MEESSIASKRALGNWTLIVLFLIAIVFLLIGLYSQTQVTLRESRARSFNVESIALLHSNTTYTLTITYPEFLLLASAEKSRAPLTLQLFPFSTTVTTTQPTFIVTLSSTSDVIDFTDREGVPRVPSIVVTPTLATSAVIYLHQSTSVTSPRPPRAKISVQVHDAEGNPKFSSPPNLNVILESGEDLFWSRLYELLGTTSIFISLVTGLMGIGWKWWEQEQKERERREQQEKERQEQERREQERKRNAIETALDKIKSLEALLHSNVSEAARRYWEYSHATDFPWQESEVKNRLPTVWVLNAPRELQNLVTLQRAFPEQWTKTLAQIGNDAAIQSLIWAWRMLDEDWQQRIRSMLVGNVEKEIQARSWQAILKPWRQVYFWKPGYSSTPLDVAKALGLLGLERNPFGSARAECDELLFDTWVDVEWASLQAPQLQTVVGKPGSGKTALALFIIRASVCAKTAFPIYVSGCPTEPTRRAQLDYLARAVARTLLHFVAFYPKSFLEQDIASRSAMAHLLGMYIGVGKDLALQFQKAGLEPIGEGRRMHQELERLLSNTALAAPPEDEMLALLGAARPHGFPYTLVLVDLPDTTQNDVASVWLDLAALLQGELVYLKILGSDELKALAKNVVVQLGWLEGQLQTLLRNRLGVVGVESLATWCAPSAQQFSPEQRLVQAAQGLPGRLIHLGNQLLAQLTTHPDDPRLTEQDLHIVLGPL